MNRERKPADGAASIKEIRESVSIYPNVKFNVLRWLLESISLTLEAFIHLRIGEGYISLPKAVVGSLFLYSLLFLSFFGFSVYIIPDPTQIGGISIVKALFQSLLEFDWHKAWASVTQSAASLWTKEGRDRLLDPVHVFVAFYSVVINFHFLSIFICKHQTPPKFWHPRSSGDPWPVWNWLYRIGYYYNIRTDMVKQIGEPVFCFLLGSVLGWYLPSEWQFVSTWLRIGSLALFLRAYLENRNKKRLILERLANEFDALGFELQDQLYTREPSETEFVEAVGKERD